MSYESPIELLFGELREQMINGVFEAVQNVKVNVDKDELIKALQYDRGQYDKGYSDGLKAANDKIVRCKDCKWFYLGDCEWMLRPQINNVEWFCPKGERREEK